jgi:hypothetical protein
VTRTEYDDEDEEEEEEDDDDDDVQHVSVTLACLSHRYCSSCAVLSEHMPSGRAAAA